MSVELKRQLDVAVAKQSLHGFLIGSDANQERCQTVTECVETEPSWVVIDQMSSDVLVRLSLCSLPVLKQSEGSLGSLISVATRSGAAPGSLGAVRPDVLRFVECGFYAAPRCDALQVQSSTVLDPEFGVHVELAFLALSFRQSFIPTTNLRVLGR